MAVKARSSGSPLDFEDVADHPEIPARSLEPEPDDIAAAGGEALDEELYPLVHHDIVRGGFRDLRAVTLEA
jgi:hypothetical protein